MFQSIKESLAKVKVVLGHVDISWPAYETEHLYNELEAFGIAPDMIVELIEVFLDLRHGSYPVMYLHRCTVHLLGQPVPRRKTEVEIDS